ncbi:MAG: ATP-dependent DNA ligase, partial [Candidatus Nanoarchaeia archaeon]|nr:ATP-dependent DNA ligase [Candidatus Nanoarchaeia archaeon]
MKYQDLVELYDKMASTTKRLEKTEILANFLKKIKKENLDKIIRLVQGSVFPQWDSRKIGFSSQLMLKAIANSTGEDTKEIEKLWAKKGDLGVVVEDLVKHKKQKTLFSKELKVDDVYENIKKLAEMEGAGTVNRKVGLVSELLTSATPKEAKYIVRTVLEELRVGIAEGIVRDAIAQAFDKEIKDVEKAFELTVDYGEVAELAKENNLGKVDLQVGRPVKLMLAIIVKDVEEGFERVGKPAAIEQKYDGFRLQLHKNKKEIKLFTRRMENVTKQFPDVVDAVEKYVKGDKFILDCEAVGYDPKSGKYLPFQKISQRIKRKYDIEKTAKEFPVEAKVFDVLEYEGKSYLDKPLKERRKLLEKIVGGKKNKLVLSELLITDDVKKAEKFYNDSLKLGHEGVMIKSLEASYKPGRYVGYMCKLKNILEALDLVIIGAEWGEGKRAKWLSSYTIACQKDGELLEVGKVSTGMKEKGDEG